MVVKILCLAFLVAAALAAPNPPKVEDNTRIVGGSPTTIENFPYIAAIVYHYTVPNIHVQRCVGSIISSWHVLTTGFCFTGAILENMKVRAGSTYSLNGGVLVDIFDMVKHPDYVETPRAGDIAIVNLATPLAITDSVNILFIPPQGTYIPDGTSMKVVSWGFESESGPQIESLKTVNINKIGLEECQQIFTDQPNEVVIQDSVICAGETPSMGMCLGDSGAPMVIGSVVVGLSSYYKQCGDSAIPDVFTRIDRYTNWILDNTSSGPGRNGTAVRTAPVTL